MVGSREGFRTDSTQYSVLSTQKLSSSVDILEKSALLENVILSRVLCGEGPRMGMGTAYGLNRTTLDFFPLHDEI